MLTDLHHKMVELVEQWKAFIPIGLNWKQHPRATWHLCSSLQVEEESKTKIFN